MSELLTETMKASILRTLTPIAYALILKTGVAPWLGIEQEIVQSVAAGLAAVALYVTVRVLERARPRWGWLIGYAKQPSDYA